MYITSVYIITPVNPKATSRLKYWDNPNNFVADEVVSITRNLNDSDLKRANLILDLEKKEVLKCRRYQLDGKMVTEPNYVALLASLRSTYPNQVGLAETLANENIKVAV